MKKPQFDGRRNRALVESHWNRSSGQYFAKHGSPAVIERILANPSAAFHRAVFAQIKKLLGRNKKKICVPASGDNHAVFAFCVLGHEVTSIDMSTAQIENARRIAETHDLAAHFIVSDLLHMSSVPDGTFDFVFTSNGVLTWIDDLPAMFAEIQRVLKSDGEYLLFDVHPFQRPWTDDCAVLQMEKPYRQTGPVYLAQNEGVGTFHWRMEDILNALIRAGFRIMQLRELPSGDATEPEYFWGTDVNPEMNDWKTNPRSGLPVWLEVLSTKANS